jgi:hypothetical protein
MLQQQRLVADAYGSGYDADRILRFWPSVCEELAVDAACGE